MSSRPLGRAGLRGDFPLLDRMVGTRKLVYLDSSATTLVPHTVAQAMFDHQLYTCGTVNRGQHLLAEEATAAYELGRQELAWFLGCSADEVVEVPGSVVSDRNCED